MPENGGISVIVPHGGMTYIGGNFDELAAITGAFARVDFVYRKTHRSACRISAGEVRASVPDGNGGFYIGGTFFLVGSETCSKIVRRQRL